ncbi:hypothetical protein [Rhizobium dioscoreae]|uniref:hypothetical protein n=1 Tax=Rhizobium TaxID=379 RepID=UPI0012610B08|nr:MULTISPECIES: hypothetical protein [Rhizobium]
MLTKEDVAASPCCLHPAVRKGINLLAFLKQSGIDSAISKHKLKKREALLLNSYNLRNVVNNSLSLPGVLTFYFGSAVPPPDILALRQQQFAWAGEVSATCGMLSLTGFTKISPRDTNLTFTQTSIFCKSMTVAGISRSGGELEEFEKCQSTRPR